MISSLFNRPKSIGNVPALYMSIVAQSRREGFFRDWGVPDTMTGRFDMISLHMCLVLRRLRHEGRSTQHFCQDLFDYFFQDMDRSLREAGVGDLSIGKRIGKMGELFYGLLLNLNRALDAGDREDMNGVLSRNVFAGETPESLSAFTAYVFGAAEALEGQDPAGILNGNVAFAPVP